MQRVLEHVELAVAADFDSNLGLIKTSINQFKAFPVNLNFRHLYALRSFIIKIICRWQFQNNDR